MLVRESIALYPRPAGGSSLSNLQATASIAMNAKNTGIAAYIGSCTWCRIGWIIGSPVMRAN